MCGGGMDVRMSSVRSNASEPEIDTDDGTGPLLPPPNHILFAHLHNLQFQFYF